jgi:hypothetical protein
MQPGWGDAADYISETDMEYRIAALTVPAVVKPQTDTNAATSSLTPFGEIIQACVIVPGQSQMPQLTSPQRSGQMRLGSEKPQVQNHIVSLMSDTVSNSSQMEIAKPVQPVSFYPCI